MKVHMKVETSAPYWAVYLAAPSATWSVAPKAEWLGTCSVATSAETRVDKWVVLMAHSSVATWAGLWAMMMDCPLAVVSAGPTAA